MRTVIGIDPGTHCGFAVRHPDGDMHSGVWDLSGSRYEGGGMRYVRLHRLLCELLDCIDWGDQPQSEFVLVAYEEVHRHLGTAAAHIYGGIVAVITQECEQRGVPYLGIPVGTIKKYATGRGNSGKEAMIAAALEKWPQLWTAQTISSDEADARWIAEYAATQEM